MPPKKIIGDMHVSRKISAGLIIVFFVGVLLYAYTTSMQSKKNPKIYTLPITPVVQREHMLGNKNAQVTIVEYSDFECPECIYFQPTIKQILQTFGGKIRWVVRFYPLPQHTNAEKEAEAAECVAELRENDIFWKFSDELFAQTNITQDGTGFPLEKLPSLAKQVGVSQKDFSVCLSSGKFYNKIQNTIANANTAGIQQFPSTIIIDTRGNMQLVTGNQPFTVYKNIIEQALIN